MSDQEINEAIANAVGWTDVRANYQDTGRILGRPPDARPDGLTMHREVPNFTNSLDACASFERTLEARHFNSYVNNIAEQYDAEGYMSPEQSDFALCTATPLQRCEAFLRMKGLWK